MPFTAYTDNELLNHLLGPVSYTKPAAVYVALFNGDPASGGTEVSTTGSAYTRLAATFSVSLNVATNSANIEWPVSTTAWGTIDHIAVYDAVTGGNQLVTAALTTAKTLAVGDVFRIPASNLTVTLT